MVWSEAAASLTWVEEAAGGSGDAAVGPEELVVGDLGARVAN